MLAAIGDTPYNIVRLVHLVAVVVGAGLAFTAPVLASKARTSGGRAASEAVAASLCALIFPSLLVAGVAGGALVGMSNDFWDFGQRWLSLGGAIWMVVLAATLAAYPPTWMQVFNVDDKQRKIASGVVHLGLAVMFVLMVWKMGAPEGAW